MEDRELLEGVRVQVWLDVSREVSFDDSAAWSADLGLEETLVELLTELDTFVGVVWREMLGMVDEGVDTGAKAACEAVVWDGASDAFWKNEVILEVWPPLLGDDVNRVWKMELAFLAVEGDEGVDEVVELCFVISSWCAAFRAKASCLFFSIYIIKDK